MSCKKVSKSEEVFFKIWNKPYISNKEKAKLIFEKECPCHHISHKNTWENNKSAFLERKGFYVCTLTGIPQVNEFEIYIQLSLLNIINKDLLE